MVLARLVMVMEVVMSDLMVMAMLVEFDVVMEMRMAAPGLVIDQGEVLRPNEGRREEGERAKQRNEEDS